MEAVKLREHYQQALLLLSNLQQHPATHERALSKLFLLVRLCYSIQKTATSLSDKDSSTIWQQRAATLHSDLTTATAQFLQSGDQSGEQFWDGCLRLLYCGAEAYDQIEKEKDTLVAQLLVDREHRARLEQTLLDQHQKLEAGAKETMELRSKIATQQQIIEPLEKNYRETHHRLDVTIKEKHALAAEKDHLDQERIKNLQILERQAKAIQQLMEQCEAHNKEKTEALESATSLNEDNHTLRVNLGQHGQVIENLINLNAEMMDAANYYSVQLEQKKTLDEQQEQVQPSSVDGDKNEENVDNTDESLIDTKSTVPSEVHAKQASPPLRSTEFKSEAFLGSSSTEIKSESSLGPSLIGNEFKSSAGSSPTKITTGPPPDLFSRIKGIKPSSDAAQNSSTTEQTHPLNTHLMPVQNGEGPLNRSEGKRKNIAWTSDMLISQRGSASLENLHGLDERETYLHGSSSFDNLKDLDERASTAPSSAPNVLRKLGGIGGRLQAVGGKARGFLDFVAGADLAPKEGAEEW
ncbi:unnamed protein product [Calypogeia fissa]